MSGSRRKSSLRNAVLGADRAFRVIDGDGGAQPPPPTGSGTHGGDDPCPVQALGDSDGTYFFIDPLGQKREFSAHQLGNRENLVSLFRGDDKWLQRHFPYEKEFKRPDKTTEIIVVGFMVKAAAQFLIKLASDKGLFGTRIQVRKPWIWRTDDGMPIVHCGDQVMIDGEWRQAGCRPSSATAQLFAAAEATPRPATPCDHSVAVQLQRDLQTYWSFKQSAGPISLIGQLYSGYLCGALDWRMNTFVTGGTASGKTAARKVLRNCWPLHGYSNDHHKGRHRRCDQGLGDAGRA